MAFALNIVLLQLGSSFQSAKLKIMALFLSQCFYKSSSLIDIAFKIFPTFPFPLQAPYSTIPSFGLLLQTFPWRPQPTSMHYHRTDLTRTFCSSCMPLLITYLLRILSCQDLWTVVVSWPSSLYAWGNGSQRSTLPYSVSEQAGGKGIKVWLVPCFFRYIFHTSQNHFRVFHLCSQPYLSTLTLFCSLS